MVHYYKYWGKADGSTGQWHPLVCHMLDVASVASAYVYNNAPFKNDWCRRMEISDIQLLDMISFFAAIHDLGKFASDFQCKIPELSQNLQGISSPPMTGESHSASAWILWNKFLKSKFYEKYGINDKVRIKFSNTVQPLLSASFGHHGGPVNMPANRSNLTFNKLYGHERGNAAWKFIIDLMNLLPGFVELLNDSERLIYRRKELNSFSFALSGLIILADWTASASVNFDYLLMKNEIPLNGIPGYSNIKEYFNYARDRAIDALTRQGLIPSGICNIIDPWSTLFPSLCSDGYSPSPLQKAVMDLDLPVGPALYIIEDAAGSGKTEAALLLTTRLMGRGEAEGFYFGLPTMATSNGMYNRISGIYKKLFGVGMTPSLILAHGGSGLHEEFQKTIVPEINNRNDYELGITSADISSEQIDNTASCAACSEWIADRSKKVFLAQVGIGSIDQAMLSVIYSRHNTLRMFGLSQRILIIDEVHAYDVYMQKILQNLVQFQASQKKSVIILSATLPSAMKMQLLKAYAIGLCLHEDGGEEKRISEYAKSDNPYPLVTVISRRELRSIPLTTREDNHRNISIRFITSMDIVEPVDVLKSASSTGKCAVWIRNTVSDVQKAYEALCREIGTEKVMIFHSRYTMGHRQQIENDVLKIFGKNSTSEHREGKILVASQVVEQSLDLDFDEMITDLCPVDLVIQRSGRLKRHNRDEKGNPIIEKDKRGEPIIYIHGPDPDGEINKNWYSNYFSSASYVYSHPGILWRTARVLKDEGSIAIPESSRFLVERVYGNNAPEIPQVLEEASDKSISRENREKAAACGNIFPLHNGFIRPDDTGPWPDTMAPTRLTGDTETYRLCILDKEKLRPLITDHDHAWPMSEVKYRHLEIEYSQELTKLINKTNAGLYDKGRGGSLLPLAILQSSEEVGFVYRVIEKTKQGKSVLYDEKTGFRIE